VKLALVVVAVIGGAGCGAGTEVPATPPAPAASIDFACGPWKAVGPDEAIGPGGLTARQAFAAIAGSHELDGPSVTGNPDDRGLLTVDIDAPAGLAGLGRVVFSTMDDPAAPRGSCGARIDVAARAYTPDGALDVTFDRVHLWLAPGGEDMTATLSRAMPDALPEPYQSTEPLTLDVGMLFGPQRPLEIQAALNRAFNHDQIWAWSGTP
jgi:hypothetical protein